MLPAPVTEHAKFHLAIARHPIDMNSLVEDISQRIATILGSNAIGCFYFNPAVTVTCSDPLPVFFNVVKKEQSRWCRQASATFTRRVRRRASQWVSGGEWTTDKFDRFKDRALCFTGVLFIDGKAIPHHEWQMIKTKMVK